MAINLSTSPASTEVYNLGGVTMHVMDFTTGGLNSKGPRGFYSSSLPSIVGYWFSRTEAPTTASLVATDVSLINASTGQFRFLTSEARTKGKLYVLSLT